VLLDLVGTPAAEDAEEAEEAGGGRDGHPFWSQGALNSRRGTERRRTLTVLHSNHAVAGPAAIVETTSTTLDWAEHQLRPPTRRLWWWSLPPCTDPGTCLYTASAGQQGAPASRERRPAGSAGHCYAHRRCAHDWSNHAPTSPMCSSDEFDIDIDVIAFFASRFALRFHFFPSPGSEVDSHYS